jgi:hypothetical protein
MSNGFIGPSFGEIITVFLLIMNGMSTTQSALNSQYSCTPHHNIPGFLASLNKFDQLDVVEHNV